MKIILSKELDLGAEVEILVTTMIASINNPLTYKGQVETIQDLPNDAENGYIQSVVNENKNYIWNGIEWIEYISTIDFTTVENKITEKGTIVSPTEPTTGEKVWLQSTDTEKNLYIKNEDGTYEEFLNIEEGTWIPRLTTVEQSAPTVEYIFREGNYIRLGNLVYISFNIRGKITALTGTDNYACIAGLPYECSHSNLGQYSITTGVIYNAIYNAPTPSMSVYNSVIRMLRSNGSQTASWIKTDGEYFQLAGSGWYHIG